MKTVVISFVVILVTVVPGDSIWVGDVTSARGLDIGSGLLLKLSDNKNTSSSIFERISLDLNYGPMGVSARKAKSDAVELDFYVKNKNEGRGGGEGGSKKFLPILIGYKAATIMTIIITGLKVLTIKALMLAKFALIVSMSLLFYKLLKHEKHYHHPEVVEVEQHADYSDHFPVYAEYGHHGGSSGAYRHSGDNAYAGAAQYYAYNNYAPSAAESSNFAVVDANATGSTIRRRDLVAEIRQRKLKLPSSVLKVRKYSTVEE